ncbi:hypothetical protein DB347_08430 [Opitutaceae bacterium EW11]|nr:hypothetical protein DB347_08430 [Opitutaceae bacterium EW11]
MFRRVILDYWFAIFPLVAFLTALVVYVSITYKALRMRPSQIDHLAQLPFNDQTPASHEHAAES